MNIAKRNYLLQFGLIFTLVTVFASYLEASVFKNPRIHTTDSPLMVEKKAKADSLLPEFNGDKQLRLLLQRVPELWSLNELDSNLEILTELEVNLVFVDGTREDDWCKIDSSGENSGQRWKINIGVDFVSASSSNVVDHVRLCLMEARKSQTLKVKDVAKGTVRFFAPQVLEEEMNDYEVIDDVPVDLREHILKMAKEVLKTGECPRNPMDYLMLRDIYHARGIKEMDLYKNNQMLNPNNNGERPTTSCAYSRSWNQIYNEGYKLVCNLDKDECQTIQSEQGKENWKLKENGYSFRFIGNTFWWWDVGPQSIHNGGNVMDMNLYPLANNLVLETYVNKEGLINAIGLIILEN